MIETRHARGKRVVSIVVTYGDRYEVALGAVSCAIEAGAARVILVDNNSMPSGRLASYFAGSDNVEVLTQHTNLGSAGGYAAGLTQGLKDDEVTHFWLLDDDNHSTPSALQKLIRVAESGGPFCAALGTRPGRPSDLGTTDGRIEGSFMYFDAAVQLQRRLRRRPRVVPDDLPYGPYGGLLLTREAVERIGIPRSDYVLYEDDTEYTYRLTRLGGSIKKVDDALIDDVVTSWAVVGDSGMRRLILTDAVNYRYYAVRNRVHFDTRIRRRARARLLANAIIYAAVLVVRACSLRQVSSLREIFVSMLDGALGRLGPRRPL